MKKTILALVFLCLFFITSLASSAQDGCKDFAYLHIDMEDNGGYVEVYYVDCEGDSRKEVFKQESGAVCVDTHYEILLVPVWYDDYEFIGWGNDEISGGEVEMFMCDDLYLAPRFQEYPDYHHHHDDYDDSCFIQSLK